MSTAQRRQVTLVAVLDDQGDPPRWMDWLLRPGIEELNNRHPDLNIPLDYWPIPYQNLHEEFANAMANQTAVDILTVDYVWLREYVEKGYLTDPTEYAQKWGREEEWYSANWASGGIYNDKVYGICTMAEVRAIWYWKGMLTEANVDPNSLRTWDSYIYHRQKDLILYFKDKPFKEYTLLELVILQMYSISIFVDARRRNNPAKGGTSDKRCLLVSII